MTGKGYAERRLYLSKSDFLNHRMCPGFAWMVKHRPDLVPTDMDPLSIRRLLQGEAVEGLVRTMYLDAVLIDTLNSRDAVRQTEEAIADGAETLFQAGVLTESGMMARADILVRAPEGYWELVEVKASTDARDHCVDAAFQAIAFTSAGYEIRSVQVMHLNRAFRRSGEPDPRMMMAVYDATGYLDVHLSPLMEQIDAARAAILNPEAPAICLCYLKTRSRRCPTLAHFHPDVPASGGVYDLAMVQAKTIRQVLDRGIGLLADWPADVKISAKQQRQIAAHRSGVESIDASAIRLFLEDLVYPLHFLDYETADAAIPAFDGHAPWQKVPFQYSLHVIEKDGTSRHGEYLWTTPGTDPIPRLVTELAEEIGPVGSVVVWNKSFEAGCNRIMANLHPPAAPFLQDVNDRMIDLADVVSKGYWVHPAFGGRWSLKAVLPVAAPDLSYDQLKIGNGGMASVEWARCVLDDPTGVAEMEREAIFAALREYCHLDTQAMVRILEHLKGLVE